MIGAPYTLFDIRFSGTDDAPGVNPYSARGLKGTLSPIDAAKGSDKLRRTINGKLIDISAPQMRRYQLQINGDDQAPPALDGLWVGMEVIVDSIVEQAFLNTGGAVGERPPVPGSVRFEGDFCYYRPRYWMAVVDLQIEQAEWDASVSWQITLEEVDILPSGRNALA